MNLTESDAQANRPAATNKPGQFALLIAVDFYFQHRLPNGSYYPSLAGCVRDVSQVETFLTSRLGLDPDHILKLTATNSGDSAPPEPDDIWPTYENMVAKFKQLAEMAQPGDQVYIHYSGHGGRAKTIQPDLKGGNGFDEALVPTDIGDPNSRYLRDFELAYLLQAMVDKGLIVTIVLDCCHSGSATRGDAVARGIELPDTSDRPTDSLVALSTELKQVWIDTSGKATRSAKPDVSWLLEPRGYTLLAACRANESAYEYSFNGRERNGALTYWLLDSLRQAESGFSYKMIFDRILAKIHSQFDRQTPQLQGEGNRVIFGSDEIKPHYAVAVMQVLNDGQRLRLGAGEAHGLQPGTELAIYPHGTTSFEQESARIALAEIDQVEAVESQATITEQLQDRPIEAGAQAVLLSAVNIRLQRQVSLDIEESALRQQLEAALLTDGKGFVKPIQPGEQMDFQVALNSSGEYEIRDPGDNPISNLNPPLKRENGEAITRLIGRLVHLAKYRNVQALDAPSATMRQELKVELVDAAGTITTEALFRPDEQGKLKITNLQTPNQSDANDPRRILNICVLALESNWAINQVYPSQAGLFEAVDPGQTIELDLEAYLPDGYTDSTDILKIFATRGTTDFRWLSLPPLDQPSVSTASRSMITDPLEQMLAAFTAETSDKRAIRFSSGSDDQGWTVVQVEVTVRQ